MFLRIEYNEEHDGNSINCNHGKGYKLDVVAIVYDSSCVCLAFLPVVDAEICVRVR